MLRANLKIALRNLWSQCSYSLLTIIGLAVGIAGGLLLFLFVEHHLSTDRHHADYDRIFRIVTDLHLDDGSIEPYPEAPQPMAQALRTDYPQVEQAAFLVGVREMTVGPERTGQTELKRFREHKGVGFVEPQWVDVLTYRWLQGDPKTALSQPNRAVLSESWARRYFGDTNPMGQRLLLDNKTAVTVAGIVAEPPGPTDTYLGLMLSMATLKQHDPELDQTSWWQLSSLNRLYVRLRQAGDSTAIARTFPALLKKQFGAEAHFYRFGIQPLSQVHFDVSRLNAVGVIPSSLLWSLGVIGALLIAAACINFINMATAQALRRSKEVGIRKALGSSRRQLVGQFLLEATLLCLAALLLALLLVAVTLPLFNDWVELNLSLRPNWPTTGFLGLLLGGIVLVAGGYPALVLSGFSPLAVLRGKLATPSAGRGVTVRQALVTTQFVICQALLIGALVVSRQVRYVQEADLGFRKDNVLMVNLPDRPATTRLAAYEPFRQRVLQQPDILSISFEHRSPASELNYGGQFKFNGKPNWELYPIRERLADANYLKTYGLTLAAGRNVTPSDSIREYLINETLARQLGFQDPAQVLGKTMQYHLSPVPLPIVGVVKDFHQKSLRQPIEPCVITTYPAMYRQAGIRFSGTNPGQTMQRIRGVWQQLYPSEVFEYTYLDEQLARFYQTETLVARLINVFTGVAILICCLGLYGLVSFVVVQRTKEIGVRKVLGASVASIVAMLSTDFLKLVLIALLIASPIAGYVMNGWLQDFAYRVDLAWWVFALAGTLAIIIALLTVSYQSIKAALMNPVNALRSE
ncbi:ABC transporter permease [uncultured Fibrella sp.]|uniref:ABC transporter permease n=1 Tax=uncultured Fibrella sp. TaxID=1284596 RepID=UPI0035C95C2D